MCWCDSHLSGKHCCLQDPRYRNVDASTLMVDGVDVSDRGLFRCTATNEAGSTSANARVEILSMFTNLNTLDLISSAMIVLSVR